MSPRFCHKLFLALLGGVLAFAGAASALADAGKGVTDADRAFWSFRPLSSPVPPQSGQGDWARNAIDRFVLAKLTENGLTPTPEASRERLIRRLYFDVIGLPPTPQELADATAEPAADWYERLVDKLLASPHYGERWGRHWLDVARFAESDGYESDTDRPTAWYYRDFVIKALNADLPFDQFVRLQIAGDEAAADDANAPDTKGATGFVASATTLRSFEGTKREREEWRYDELDDIVSTTGSAFLGLTVGCARCHDHKFDPIPTRDYYRLVAAFATTQHSPAPQIPKPGQTIKFKPEDRTGPPLGVTDVSPTPATAYLLSRGDVEKKTSEVTLGFLTVLTPTGTDGSPAPWWQVPAGAKTTYQRTALAKWLTDANRGAGALTARVIVNRLWQHHFGEGLVRTPSDFGTQGDRPSHPELLDSLASELVGGAWRLKHIHRLILTSATYRQDVTFDAAKANVDPENRLLWRRRPLRNEAEVMRDSIMAISGKLDLTMFGPSVKPAIPAEAMAGRNKDSLERPAQDAPEQWRRSVYLFAKRSLPTPSLTSFDQPIPVGSCARRTVSTVAPQALFLLNDPFVRRQAGYFAERCLAEAKPGQDDGANAAACVRAAYLLALSRVPREQELDRAVKFLTGRAEPERLTDLCHVLLTSNEFLYID